MRNLFVLLIVSLFVTSTIFSQNRPPAAAQPAPKPAAQPAEQVKPKPLTEDMFKKIIKDTLAMKANRDEIKKMDYMKKLAATPYEVSFKLAPVRETDVVYFKFTLQFVNNAQKMMRLKLCFTGAVSDEGQLWSNGFSDQFTSELTADDNMMKRMKNGMKNFVVKAVFKFDENGINEFNSFRRDRCEVLSSGSKRVISYKIYDGATLLFESGKR